MKKMYEWYIYKEKKKTQLRVILFVQFRIPHVFFHITSTSLTLKPSRFVRSPSIRNIGLRPYLEKLKIRVETRYKAYVTWYNGYHLRKWTWLVKFKSLLILFMFPFSCLFHWKGHDSTELRIRHLHPLQRIKTSHEKSVLKMVQHSIRGWGTSSVARESVE